MSALKLYNPTTALGAQLAEGVNKILEGKALIGRVNQRLYAAIYVPSGPADMAAVETELGAAAGDGQGLFDAVDACKLALDDSRIVALREIDQG